MRVNKATHMHLSYVLAIALASVGAAGLSALPGCNGTCGNVSIPYPFGVGKSSHTGKNCFLENAFELSCTNSVLYHGRNRNVQILNIALQGQLDTLYSISEVCYNETTGGKEVDDPKLQTPSFSISSKHNKFISVGCDTYGFLSSFLNGATSSTGCFTRCSLSEVQTMQSDGRCRGRGCCQVDIPPRMRKISLKAFSFNNFRDTLSFNNCSYSFIVKNGSYTFSMDHLRRPPFQNNMAPIAVDWTVGKETCQISQRKSDYACKNNSECEDADTEYGYRCKCKQGYHGNPYLPDGCQDIKECESGTHNCASQKYCHEIDGSFECRCPDGQSGNATMGGRGCSQNQQDNIIAKKGNGKRKKLGKGAKFAIGAGVSQAILVTIVVTILLQTCLKWKLIKFLLKLLRRIGSFLLQQQLSTRKDSSHSVQIFTAEELRKATNNYNDSFIISKGGYGTVYKGSLLGDRVVAVMKSKIGDQSQIEQFINEVVVLSQINHQNVVKLLGYCLETKDPLLVYEFVNNGTLFDYLYNKGKASSNLSWKTRLRIAAEVARALSYLHSIASIPIIHRDVKSANILLDDTYTAKVSNFGVSQFVPQDQTKLATMMHETLRYLDPKYMQTSQLTEKSDVYNFGVVLVELLSGEKELSLDRPDEKRSLAMHFLSSIKEDRLFEVVEIGILNEENKEEIKEVAILAESCLRLREEDRPSMKEVELELERRLMEKHQWIDTDLDSEEIQNLPNLGPNIYEHGDSSNHGNSGFDSIANQVLTFFDDGT